MENIPRISKSAEDFLKKEIYDLSISLSEIEIRSRGKLIQGYIEALKIFDAYPEFDLKKQEDRFSEVLDYKIDFVTKRDEDLLNRFKGMIEEATKLNGSQQYLDRPEGVREYVFEHLEARYLGDTTFKFLAAALDHALNRIA